MDYFAHGFWGYILFNRTKQPFYAVLFALIPDSFSWLIYLIYQLFTGGWQFGRPDAFSFPDWVFTLYGLSHSLVISGAVILVVYLVLKKIPIYMWAWPITIVMDTLTHTRDFLPTPFLYPISNWHFPGISWGTGWFMLINWSLILIFLSYIVVKKRMGNHKNKNTHKNNHKKPKNNKKKKI